MSAWLGNRLYQYQSLSSTISRLVKAKAKQRFNRRCRGVDRMCTFSRRNPRDTHPRSCNCKLSPESFGGECWTEVVALDFYPLRCPRRGNDRLSARISLRTDFVFEIQSHRRLGILSGQMALLCIQIDIQQDERFVG